MHLGPVAQVRREDLALGSLALCRDIGTHPVVGAAQSDREGTQHGIPTAAGGQARQRPGGDIEDLQRDVGEGSAAAGLELGDRHDQRTVATRRPGVDLHHGGPGVLAQPDRRARKGRRARRRRLVPVTPVDDEDGTGDLHAGRYVDQDGVGKERVVEPDQGVPPFLDVAHHVPGAGYVAGSGKMESRLLSGDDELPGVPVVHQHVAGQRAQHGHQLVAVGASGRAGAGRSRGRGELIELEVVDG